jgi:hypothetical protein
MPGVAARRLDNGQRGVNTQTSGVPDELLTVR